MAVENFTTYAEVNPNSHISKTATRATSTTLGRDETAYLYKDKTAGFFAGDFEHLVTTYLSSTDTNGRGGVWMISNDLGDRRTLTVDAKDYLGLFWAEIGGLYYLYLTKLDSAGTLSDPSSALSITTNYYLKIVRDESIGTYGKIYCYIYSNLARTTLVDTLEIELSEKLDFRYIYAAQSYNDDVASATISLWSENLDLQEVGLANLKSVNSIAKANIKSINGIAIANVKSVNTIT